MRYLAGLAIALAACTSATGSPTSTTQTTVPTSVGLPCVSESGDIAADTIVTVRANDQEIDAVLGWVSAGPCLGDGTRVVSDGFFAGLEEAVLTMDGGPLRVLAPGFDEAEFEAMWNGPDGSESPANVTNVETGVWELEAPSAHGTHVLNLRFDYGDDLDAAFAVTVDLQG